MSDMAKGVTSVRLGDLATAVDREAKLARCSPSKMIRFLIEDGLALRRSGIIRVSRGRGTVQIEGEQPQQFDLGPSWYLERFEGCPTPETGATYKVTREQWNADCTERTILEYERTDTPDGVAVTYERPGREPVTPWYAGP